MCPAVPPAQTPVTANQQAGVTCRLRPAAFVFPGFWQRHRAPAARRCPQTPPTDADGGQYQLGFLDLVCGYPGETPAVPDFAIPPAPAPEIAHAKRRADH